jgi:histone-lysine N-methyltransferase ASH1L
MSLASELDLPKPESITASSIEAVTALPGAQEPEPQQPEPQQPESGQQSPVGADAIVVAEPLPLTEAPSTSRPRRARSSLPVYNIAKLAGTDVHGRRRSKGDTVLEKRRRTISDGNLVKGSDADVDDSIDALAKASHAAQEEVDASKANRSDSILHTPRNARISKKSVASPASVHLTRRATRLSGAHTENLTTKLSALSKRGRKAVEKGLKGLSRELRRLQDTNEFAHIDTRPVRYTVWSNGKYLDVDPSQPIPAPEPPRKKVKVDGNATAVEAKAKPVAEKQESTAPAAKKPHGRKKWLEKGLYAGQEAPLDIFKGLTSQEKKKLASIPELMPSGKPNRTLPQPMYNGLRVLLNGRDFKLPFDVCHPLPPGQPKPTAYRTMTKSEYLMRPSKPGP